MDAPYEIFNDKDIRMWATMILRVRNGKDRKSLFREDLFVPMEVMCSEQMPVLRERWKDLLFVWCAGSENVFGI